MKDREKAAQLNQRCEELMEDGVKRADAVFELVMKSIRP